MKLPRGSMTILALYIFIHHMEALEVGGLTQELINVRHEFCPEEYERMIIDILSTRKILKRCRTDFPIPLNKKKLLIEKSRVMKILITMSAVSGYMVKNENGYLLSSVVIEPCFFNK
ncbi:unnamed protein product [Brassica napus]|uniref:(rape) hypothetical protein n=1 Tax=Brassica napus TaxID=3708 RepID=A0A816KR55_BRANA|nr:unnamed protein product [Brassica napus]